MSFNELSPKDLGAKANEDEIPGLRFTPEAQGLFNEFRQDLEKRVRCGDEALVCWWADIEWRRGRAGSQNELGCHHSFQKAPRSQSKGDRSAIIGPRLLTTGEG